MCWKAVLSPFAKSGPAAFDSRVYSDCTRTGDVDRLLSKVSEPTPKSIDTGRGSVTVAIVRSSLLAVVRGARQDCIQGLFAGRGPLFMEPLPMALACQ